MLKMTKYAAFLICGASLYACSPQKIVIPTSAPAESVVMPSPATEPAAAIEPATAPEPTHTPEPTQAPEPTLTPEPTHTPSPEPTPEPVAEPDWYQVNVLKSSEKLSVSFSIVPKLGQSVGFISGTLFCDNPGEYQIVTIVKSKSNVMYAKPTMDFPYTKVGALNDDSGGGDFIVNFYTDHDSDYYLPSIGLYFVPKAYEAALRAGSEEWSVSGSSVNQLENDSELAIEIVRY